MDEVITSSIGYTTDNAFCNFSFSKWWPSAILDFFGHIWTHEEYLVVFFVVQNLVVLNAAVLIT